MTASKKSSIWFWIALFGAIPLMGMAGLALIAGYFVAQAFAAAEPPATVYVEKDVVYAKVDGKELKMDMARPKVGDGPFPAVICIHGGGWKAGDKSSMVSQVYGLAGQGYVAVTVQYRLVPTGHYPSQIEDVKAAVRFVRSKAKEWKIDPDHIGVVGGSAGGHLALLLATTDDNDVKPVGDHLDQSSEVQAVVSLAGPTDLTKTFPVASEYMVVDLIGKPRKEAAEMYKLASPIHYVSEKDAPILCIHGTKDELVPYEQVTELMEVCKKAGTKAELVTIVDGTHGGGGKPEDLVKAITKMMEFFGTHLKEVKK